MITIGEILEGIRGYSPDANLAPVMQAYLMAAKAHAGQTRKSGEPYLNHPLEVAEILTGMRMDVDTIATALLHDALEDNPITKEEMAVEMGSVVAELVDGVTKIGKLKFRSKEELQAENFRKMMLAMSRDIRVILVKLADRTHNMRTLEHHKPEKQKVIAQETLDIYVPIANRLGLDRMKLELEDLCFRYIHPEAWQEIDAFLQETQADRQAFIERTAAELRERLEKDGVECDIAGRAKHRFSIFRKMEAQGLAVHEVQDLLAFRVIVPDLASCYSVLGLVHASWPPIPDRIKDYIARPKANGYQSLHTTVMGPGKRRIEIQIRTAEMHRIAEDGVAAHWQYKEGHLALSPDDIARISRVRELIDSAKDAEDATEFMETVKVEFYSDQVFVFTPAGDIKQFPQGATTLDFAYAVHTDVGNTCTGARVNGRLVPLRYELRSGDTVEIVTSPGQRPSRDWLKIARTGRAVQKIRRYLRQQELAQGERLGREMLEAELKRCGLTLEKVRSEGRLRDVLKERGHKEPEQLYVEIAQGHANLAGIVRGMVGDGAYSQSRNESLPPTSAIGSLLQRWRGRSQSPVLISGEDGVLVTYARCCSPLPGEPIAGFITRGRGITIHQAECDQLSSLDPERRIPVEWDPTSDIRHSGEIRIVCSDQPGLLANITKVCEQAKVNITRAEAHNIGDNRAMCTLELNIRDISELTRVIRSIQKIRGVESVIRGVA